MYCSNFSSSGRSNLDSIERRWNNINTVLQKSSLMDKTASQQPPNLYLRSYNLFKKVIWKTEVFTSVLCNLYIYFIFSLVYVCFSWHLFYFQITCLVLERVRFRKGQKLCVWEFEILKINYTKLLFLLLKLKPMLNIFSYQ